MCTIVLLRRPGEIWPLMLGTNRDEMLDRPWLPPGRHWLESPGIVAGLDQMGGGSWLGVNDQGVVAAVTNRTGTLGPETGKRSRGGLALSALRFPTASAALEEIQRLDSSQYRAFNLILADGRDVFWISHRGTEAGEKLGWMEVPAGISMLTDRDLNDQRSERIGRYLPLFRAAPDPEPMADDGWISWKELLADRSFKQDTGPHSAMALSEGGFATLSSSLIAIPKPGHFEESVVEWWFAAGPPDRTPYRRVKN